MTCEVAAPTEEILGVGLEEILRDLASHSALHETVLEIELRKLSGSRGCDPRLLERARGVCTDYGLEPIEEPLLTTAPMADLWVCTEVAEVLRESGWDLPD